jgi:starch synthase
MTHATAGDDSRDAVATGSNSDLQAPPRRKPRLLFVTPEMAGYVKSGGLGDVAAALPLELTAYCDVRVLIPAYKSLRAVSGPIEVVKSMPGHAELPPWSLGRTRNKDGLTVYTILCEELYGRDGTPYGPDAGVDFGDNHIRFARLSLAAAEIAAGEADPNWAPDVVHLNDWPTGLAPGYLRWKNLDTPTIMTVHNLAYQGLFDVSRAGALGIPDNALQVDGAEFHGKLSFLKSGLFYGSHVTTVSETYAREITTQEHGCGLHGLLRTRDHEGRLHGILNGIDKDWLREAPEDGGDQRDVGEWKGRAADEVRRAFNLPVSDGPLFSIVSRLVHQKGIDIAIEASEDIVRHGGQLVFNGAGESKLEEAVQELARRHPGSIAAQIGYDDELAKEMFVGSDFLLMPSRFEPCGLAQMYAQKVGTLPIARRTGGLSETIEDGRSGFLFSSPTNLGLRSALTRAFAAFSSKGSLPEMRRKAMAKAFGWADPARQYAGVYAKLL